MKCFLHSVYAQAAQRTMMTSSISDVIYTDLTDLIIHKMKKQKQKHIKKIHCTLCCDCTYRPPLNIISVKHMYLYDDDYDEETITTTMKK